MAGTYNFQGNRRLAANLRVSTRTAQRARARLERDGLIKSYLLAPGDQVEGQRAPVRRHQVVRDVERLQRAARRRLEWLRSGGRVAGTPPTPRAARPRVTADVPRRTPAPAAPAPAERAPMPPELEHFLATGELPPPSPRRSVQRGGRAPPRGS